MCQDSATVAMAATKNSKDTLGPMLILCEKALSMGTIGLDFNNAQDFTMWRDPLKTIPGEQIRRDLIDH